MDMRKAKYWGTWYQGYEGTWYGKEEKDSSSLKHELQEWLERAREKICSMEQYKNGLLKAVIVPHAGYSYSGATAAYSYGRIDPSLYDRVFVLGPCHYFRMSGCGVTPFRQVETPFGPLAIDQHGCQELVATKKFTFLDEKIDSQEHSLELQFPYLKFVFGTKHVQLVNIMVGHLDGSQRKEYAKILAPYMKDDRTLFVISSDFCHWGKRFGYQYYDKKDGEIHQSIEKLDHLGMTAIEHQDVQEFVNYLEQYQNTICGRYPISVLLEMIQYLQKTESLPLETLFVKYDQSTRCKTMDDLSVSYTAAWTLEK